MARSDEEQRIFDWLAGALPRFLRAGAQEIEEGIVAAAAVAMDIVYWLADQTYVALANDDFLLLHARNKNTAPQFNESLEALRARLQRPANIVSKPALLEEVEDILARYGGPAGAGAVQLGNDKAFWRKPADPAASKAYWSRGYRWSHSGYPNYFITILPYGTSDAARDAVSEMLRRHKALGIGRVVERREIP